MKNSFLLLLFALSISCSSDSETIFITADLKMQKTDVQSILSGLERDLSLQMGESIKYTSHEIVERDGNYYLSARSDKYTTNTLLKKMDNGLMMNAGLSCTSSACAGCCGCLPKGEYCSDCLVDKSDCVRTSSSDPSLPPN